MRDNKSCAFSPLNNFDPPALDVLDLITCEHIVCRQGIHTSGRTFTPDWMWANGTLGYMLALIGSDGKCNRLWVYLLKLLQTVTLGHFMGNWV